VFGGDHIYKMNVEDMCRFHRESSAHCTIAAIPVPIAEASQFGVIQVDAEWRITGFQEKPKNPTPIPGSPELALASMGNYVNYVFSKNVLLEALQFDAEDKKSSHDFGKDVLPRLLDSGRRLFAFDFRRNRIPGSSNNANDCYWRDVGTLDSYYDACIDLRAVDPQLDLYNQEWPIRTTPNTLPPAKFVHNADGRIGQALQSIVCEGSIISGGRVVDSVVGQRCIVHSFAEVNACVLMEDVEVGRGARLNRCIIDKHVKIPAGDSIGFDAAADAKRFKITESGLVVIAKNQLVEPLKA
jgi:glucose-1-phosphate adenylyltransferase